jgi:hypothetical protein
VSHHSFFWLELGFFIPLGVRVGNRMGQALYFGIGSTITRFCTRGVTVPKAGTPLEGLNLS